MIFSISRLTRVSEYSVISVVCSSRKETNSEREQKIQEAFDIQYNRPEYNSWHKFDRHRGYSKAQSSVDDDEASEPLMCEVADDGIFLKDELDRTEKESYEAACS